MRVPAAGALFLLLVAALPGPGARAETVEMKVGQTYTAQWTAAEQLNFSFVPNCTSTQQLYVLQFFVDGGDPAADLLQMYVNGRPDFGNCTTCVVYENVCYPRTWQVQGAPRLAPQRTLTARIEPLTTTYVNVTLPFTASSALTSFAEQVVYHVTERPAATDRWPAGTVRITARPAGDGRPIGLLFGLSVLDPVQSDSFTQNYRAATGGQLDGLTLRGDNTADQFFLLRIQALPNGSSTPLVRFDLNASLVPYPAPVPVAAGGAPAPVAVSCDYINAGVQYGYVQAPVAISPRAMPAFRSDAKTADPASIIRFNLTGVADNASLVILSPGSSAPGWVSNGPNSACRDMNNVPVPDCRQSVVADLCSADGTVTAWAMNAGPAVAYPQTGQQLPPIAIANTASLVAEVLRPPVLQTAWGASISLVNATAWWNATSAYGLSRQLLTLELPHLNDTNPIYTYTVAMYASEYLYLYGKAGVITTGQCSDIYLNTQSGAADAVVAADPPAPLAAGADWQDACFGPYLNVKAYSWCCRGPAPAANNRLFLTVAGRPRRADYSPRVDLAWQSAPLAPLAAGDTLTWRQAAAPAAACPALDVYYRVRPPAGAGANGTLLAVRATAVATTQWTTRNYTLACQVTVYPSGAPRNCDTFTKNATDVRPDGYAKPSNWSQPLVAAGRLLADPATAAGLVVRLRVYCQAPTYGRLDSFEGTLSVAVDAVRPDAHP